MYSRRPYAVTIYGRFSRSVIVSGTLVATEATDTASLTGFVGVSGALAATESADVASIAGAVAQPSTASGSWQGNYSARRFYALREQIEREREELARALVAIEHKKDEQQRAAKERAAAPPAPYLAPQIDVSDLVRDVAKAVQMAANLRRMENELIAAELLEAELQDEDDLIVALAA